MVLRSCCRRCLHCAASVSTPSQTTPFYSIQADMAMQGQQQRREATRCGGGGTSAQSRRAASATVAASHRWPPMQAITRIGQPSGRSSEYPMNVHQAAQHVSPITCPTRRSHGMLPLLGSSGHPDAKFQTSLRSYLSITSQLGPDHLRPPWKSVAHQP
jgi:hypothetical protein